MKRFKTHIFILAILNLIVTPSCVKQSEYSKGKTQKEAFDLKPFEKQLLEKEQTIEEIEEEKAEKGKKSNVDKLIEDIIKQKKEIKAETPEKKKAKHVNKILTEKARKAELDFSVKNLTGHTIYVVCFSYIKKRNFTRWRWDKSDTYKLENNEEAIIDVDTIPDEQDRKNIYGYLGVFETRKEADESIYELLSEEQKIPLDLLYKLKDQKVLLNVEKYGFKGEVLDFEFVPTKDGIPQYPELDFLVENNTGKTIFLTCFVYQIKDDMPVWKYDKTPVLKLEDGKTAIVDIDTISEKYNRVYMRGFLGVFPEDEEEKARKITYELLESKNKLSIGRLAALKGKKIILNVERYGVVGDFIDFSVHKIQRIDFTKMSK